MVQNIYGDIIKNLGERSLFSYIAKQLKRDIKDVKNAFLTFSCKPEKDFSNMSIAELKEELEERDLIKTGKKSELIQRLVSFEKGGPDAPKPKSSKKGLTDDGDDIKDGDEVQLNDWGNYEEKDTGLIFVQLPVGPKGCIVGVAVGTQDISQEKDIRGLDSVVPLTSDMIEVCKTQKWRFLNDAVLRIMEKKDGVVFTNLEKIQNR